MGSYKLSPKVGGAVAGGMGKMSFILSEKGLYVLYICFFMVYHLSHITNLPTPFPFVLVCWVLRFLSLLIAEIILVFQTLVCYQFSSAVLLGFFKCQCC